MADPFWKQLLGRRLLLTILVLMSLCALLLLSDSSTQAWLTPMTGRSGARVVAADALVTPNEPGADRIADQAKAQTAAAGFAPFVNIVPSQDGAEVLVSAGGIDPGFNDLFANVGIGPTGKKGSWTMSYSSTLESYVASVVGFSPATSEEGTVSITTTTGLNTGEANFVRFYVPAAPALPFDLFAADGNLELSIVNTRTFASELYLNIVPSFAPPGPLPLGYTLISSSYSVRASAAVAAADQPMILHMSYTTLPPGGADPHTFTILVWNPAAQRWQPLASTLLVDQRYLAAATQSLTTYALAAAPAWQDNFDDSSGLDADQTANITQTIELQGDDGGIITGLALHNDAQSGVAVSKPITASGEVAAWGVVSYTLLPLPVGTSAQVDVLAASGAPLALNVAVGADLTDLIDIAAYPSLRLRVRMQTETMGETPLLTNWRIEWKPASPTLYLPLILS